MERYCIGVDLGGTNIKAGLFTWEGELCAEHRGATEALRGSGIVLQNMKSTICDLLSTANVPLQKIACMGIGVPGLLDRKSGISIFAQNFTDWENVPMKAYFEQELHILTYIDNDVHMSLSGEWYCGAGQGSENLVLVSIGTGLGAGVVVDGRILYGATGSAGELGHMNMIRDGRPCRCGSSGCFGRYVSALGLLRTVREKLEAGAQSLLLDWTEGTLDAITADMVSAAYDKGDAVACAAMEETGTMLGFGLLNIINLYNPQCIIISGGVAAAGERLLGPARKVVKERALKLAQSACRIVLGTLGDSAGMIGAAQHAQRQIAVSNV